MADPPAAAARLTVAERAGCDRAPIDPRSREGRLELQSYIWPDEPERLARVAQAAQIAAEHPIAIDRRSAAAWLVDRLGEPRGELLTVVWQSVVNQYLDDGERAAIVSAFTSAGSGPLAWLTLEPPQRRHATPSGSSCAAASVRRTTAAARRACSRTPPTTGRPSSGASRRRVVAS